MKKLSNISNQIKNNTFSYTGKGGFEALANKYKDQIVIWLEELIPLQTQINNILEIEGIEIQKRNYTRILTKIVPNEYKEFVSVNILVRDASTIAQYYDEDYNLSTVYNKLIQNRYLKYPGKYEKFVEFGTFQKFVMLYRDDLISSVSDDSNNNTYTENLNNQTTEIIDEEIEEIDDINTIVTDIVHDETIEETKKKEIKPETNWTNLLLGKLK